MYPVAIPLKPAPVVEAKGPLTPEEVAAKTAMPLAVALMLAARARPIR